MGLVWAALRRRAHVNRVQYCVVVRCTVFGAVLTLTWWSASENGCRWIMEHQVISGLLDVAQMGLCVWAGSAL
jgi:hypothetical protein